MSMSSVSNLSALPIGTRKPIHSGRIVVRLRGPTVALEIRGAILFRQAWPCDGPTYIRRTARRLCTTAWSTTSCRLCLFLFPSSNFSVAGCFFLEPMTRTSFFTMFLGFYETPVQPWMNWDIERQYEKTKAHLDVQVEQFCGTHMCSHKVFTVTTMTSFLTPPEVGAIMKTV